MCVAALLLVQSEGGAAAGAGADSGRDSLLSAFGPQEVAQLLVAAADLDLQLPLLPQLSVLLQVSFGTPIKSKMLLELAAGLVVISIAFTPDLRDWGTSSNRPYGHPHEPLARWRAPRLGPCPPNTVLYCMCAPSLHFTGGIVLSRMTPCVQGASRGGAWASQPISL